MESEDVKIFQEGGLTSSGNRPSVAKGWRQQQVAHRMYTSLSRKLVRDVLCPKDRPRNDNRNEDKLYIAASGEQELKLAS